MNLADRMPQTSRYLTGFSFSSTTALVCTASFGVCPLSGQAQGTEVGRGPAGRPRGRRPSSCRGGLHGVRRASLPPPGQLPGSRELLSRMAGAAGAGGVPPPTLLCSKTPPPIHCFRTIKVATSCLLSPPDPSFTGQGTHVTKNSSSGCSM